MSIATIDTVAAIINGSGWATAREVRGNDGAELVVDLPTEPDEDGEDEVGEEALADLKAILPAGWTADWNGFSADDETAQARVYPA